PPATRDAPPDPPPPIASTTPSAAPTPATAESAAPPVSSAKGAAPPAVPKVVASAAPSAATPPPPLQPASNRVTGNHFIVDVATPGCAAGNECAVTLRLEANGGFHINKDYPYKIAINPASGVEFLGRDPSGASTFSKSAGDFAIVEEHVATMTVRLKPSVKGTANVSGIYKMSVCSESNCQLEQLKIALDVPVQ
ncbi:MAG: hypothetical protein ABIP39_12005, partial [Polyangiaceae bacterium]